MYRKYCIHPLTVLQDDYCRSSDSEPPVPPCPVQQRPVEPQRFLVSRPDHYPPCIHADCSARSTEQECYGVLGCSWCTTDQDGRTLLPAPRCAYQADCFGGVLNAPSPYSRMFDQSLVLSEAEDDRALSRAGPIGPVAGGIMAFFLLLALTVWGYKHWSSGIHITQPHIQFINNYS